MTNCAYHAQVAVESKLATAHRALQHASNEALYERPSKRTASIVYLGTRLVVEGGVGSENGAGIKFPKTRATFN